jgi:hypothetical protein
MVPNSSSVKAIDSPETLVRVWSLKATAVKRKTKQGEKAECRRFRKAIERNRDF